MTLAIPPDNAADIHFEDLWRFCVTAAPRLGRGTTRDVYEIPGHPDKVLKVCVIPSNQTNWVESVIYHAAGPYQSSFAEVHTTSWSGRFLVMERLVAGVTAAELASLTLPPFVNDKKPSNFGKDASGNIKMLDYGMVSFYTPPPSSFV